MVSNTKLSSTPQSVEEMNNLQSSEIELCTLMQAIAENETKLENGFKRVELKETPFDLVTDNEGKEFLAAGMHMMTTPGKNSRHELLEMAYLKKLDWGLICTLMSAIADAAVKVSLSNNETK